MSSVLLPLAVLARGSSVEVQAFVFTLGCKKCVSNVCVIVILYKIIEFCDLSLPRSQHVILQKLRLQGSACLFPKPSPACVFQVPRAVCPSVVSTRAAVSPAGALGTLQKPLQPTESRSAPGLSLCSPSLEWLGPHSRSADLESGASAAGAASCRDPAAGEEGSKQPISSASDPKPAAPEEERPRGSVPGTAACARGSARCWPRSSQPLWFPCVWCTLLKARQCSLFLFYFSFERVCSQAAALERPGLAGGCACSAPLSESEDFFSAVPK